MRVRDSDRVGKPGNDADDHERNREPENTPDPDSAHIHKPFATYGLILLTRSEFSLKSGGRDRPLGGGRAWAAEPLDRAGARAETAFPASSPLLR